MAMIIGICGEKQHGKDTFIDLLTEELAKNGVANVKRPFATPLKSEIARTFAPMLGITEEEAIRQMNTPCEKERWRLIMQWWGTEFRRYEDDVYWIRLLDSWVKTQPEVKIVTVSDVRFLNEINYIRQCGGLILRVNRPALPKEDGHTSEHAWQSYSDWDMVIENDGSLADLRKKAVEAYNLLGLLS